MKASLTVFFEDPFWVGVFERIEDGKLSVCKVTFGAEPKDYEVWDYHRNTNQTGGRQSQKKKQKCQEAFGEHRYRYEIPTSSSKTEGRNEKGAQTGQPRRTRGGGPAPI